MDLSELWACSTLVLLLPLIPAFIVFRLLPSSSEVSGPFKGLTLKLGGAFAGYFIVVLVVITTILPNFIPSKQRYDTWNIKGNVRLEPSKNVPAVRSVVFAVRPPEPVIQEDGRFSMEIVVKKDSELPSLIMSAQNYRSVTIHLQDVDSPPDAFGLEPLKRVYNMKEKTIKIETPVRLFPEKTGQEPS